MMHASCCRFCSCQTCSVWCLRCHNVSCCRFCSCRACSVWCLLCHNDACVLFQILFLSSVFCLVFVTSQRWTCLVSDSVLVEHVLSGVLSGVCDVTTMDVSCFRFCSCQACSVWCLRCYNDACVLLQILFLLRESGVCAVQDHGVHAMLQ